MGLFNMPFSPFTINSYHHPTFFSVLGYQASTLYTRGPQIPGDKLLKSCAYLLWVLSMEIIPCHTSSNWNFEVAPRLLENLQIT